MSCAGVAHPYDPDGGPLLEVGTPDDTASAAAVIAFFTAHHGRERAAVFVLAFAFIAYLYFAGTLRARWRGQPGCEALAAIVLAGAGIEVVGQCAGLGGIYALSADPSRAERGGGLGSQPRGQQPAGHQRGRKLPVLRRRRGDDVARAGIVPGWLGWAVIVAGILFVIPPIEFIGLPAPDLDRHRQRDPGRFTHGGRRPGKRPNGDDGIGFSPAWPPSSGSSIKHCGAPDSAARVKPNTPPARPVQGDMTTLTDQDRPSLPGGLCRVRCR